MSDGWHDEPGRSERRNGGPLVFGLLLILLGGMLLISQVTGFDLGRHGWPAWIIVPGACLLFLGLAIPHEGGLGAAIPGALILSTGLLLAFQEATGSYATWAYAWALVAPGSVGVALFLFGLFHARFDLIDAGLRTAAVGLGLFVGFGLFFETILNFDPEHPHAILRESLPFMAVFMGIVIVVLNVLPPIGKRKDGPENLG
jgi:hypothetical protein